MCVIWCHGVQPTTPTTQPHHTNNTQALADADRLAVMQHVVACRSLVRALRIEGLSAQLAVACCSTAGAALLANMSSHAPAEVAIAACHLLDKAPRLYTSVLRHRPTLRALLATVCDQCCGVEEPLSPASSVVPPGTPGGGGPPPPPPVSFRRESAVEAALGHDSQSTPAAALQSLLVFLERKRGGRGEVGGVGRCVRSGGFCACGVYIWDL